MKDIKVLFIGNSHTYVNDLPKLFKEFARIDGYNTEAFMIAHAGWKLKQHASEPDVKFNILNGKFDYVVLQEHAHPFGPKEEVMDAIRKIDEFIKEAHSKLVIFPTWAKKNERSVQGFMSEVHREIGKELKGIVANVDIDWWNSIDNNPDIDLYGPDGAHASIYGSSLAAKAIWETIKGDLK